MIKILVIEDESILREEIIEWLTLEDFEAYGARDGIEGVTMALRHQPDLIISDITMPHLDGYGVLLELRTNAQTANIPFIFVTARASHDAIRKGMELGADDYITKPFTRLELLQTVEARLKKKTAQNQHYLAQLEEWQQAFEQEREQRLLKGKLVAMFSHDFKNPLSSILSSNSLLRDYGDRMDDERRLKHMNRIEASVHQLVQMVDDMLIVSQLETNNYDFNPEEVDLRNLLTRIVEEFQTIYVDTHRLVLECHFKGTIIADPRLLRNIVSNLISNAAKYSPQGKKIEITLEKVDRNFVNLSVRDYGIGIPEEEQEKMFTAFQRASNVGEIKGTGLGLEIVKQAVNLHQGQISLESAVGVGTTVFIKIPIDHAERV